MKKVIIHGQVFYLPSKARWEELLLVGTLDGMPIPLPHWVEGWLNAYGDYPETELGLIRFPESWMLQPFLKLKGNFYRVHFEDVICEHCQQRCGLSATPDAASYWGVAKSYQQLVWELTAQNCPHCSGQLNRRHTIWFASPGERQS